ncbi:MAG: CSLREA domain-containing protein [Acidimicrobiia bacterium]|nr:CSLREA domain-containing protein [Acidimicrobiia bacterium]
MVVVLKWMLRGALLALVLLGLSACESWPEGSSFTVTTADDGPAAAPGDGVCEMTSGAGDCSLRAAIDEANAEPDHHNVVTIAEGIDPVLSLPGTGDDANASGDLDVHGPLTVVGGGATIDGAGLDRVFDVHAGRLELRGVTVTGGEADVGGGVLLRGGTLVVADSTVSANESSVHGGGLAVAGGSATVMRSTISGNSAPSGAALQREGGSVTVRHSTVAENAGGPSLVRSGADVAAVRLGATIVSSPDVACSQPVTSLGHNLVSDDTCTLAAPGDRESTPVVLGPLAHNGGPTATHLPAAGSPANDAVPVSTPHLCDGLATVDQRGQARPQGIGCTIGAVETDGVSQGQHLVVDSDLDGGDAVPGDGVCATAGGGCTLRAAVDEANASPTVDRITIAPGVNPTLAARPLDLDEDDNASGDLDVHGTVVIEGGGATISGFGGSQSRARDRVFDHHLGHLVVRDVTITDGYRFRSWGTDEWIPDDAHDGGGAILARSSLTLERSRLEGNVLNFSEYPGDDFPNIECCGFGGGLAVFGATAIVEDSVIADNSSLGPALHARGAAQLLVRRTAIVDNQSPGVGIDDGAKFVAQQVTISGNSGVLSGGLWSAGRSTLIGVTVAENGNSVISRGWDTTTVGEVHVTGSILAGGCTHPVTSLGYSAASSTSCGLIAVGDQQGVDPLLVGLGASDPSSPVHLLDPASPAVDVVPVGSPLLCGPGAVDQRGVPRPVGAGCDAGAAEGGFDPGPPSYVVDTPDDGHNAAPGDGVCATATGACTLRAAVEEASANPNPATITIAPGVNPVRTIFASLVVTGDLTVVGNGATIDAQQRGRVFEHQAGTLVLEDLTLTGGSAYGSLHGNGGGIHASAPLVVRDSHIVGNRARGYIEDDWWNDGYGGGIYGTADIVVERSTIAGNETGGEDGGFGAGIAGRNSSLTVVDSTISGNQNNLEGSALWWANGETMLVRNSTISGNVSAWQDDPVIWAPGIVIESSTVVGPGPLLGGPSTVLGTVLWATSGGVCQFGTVTSGGGNVASDTSCGLTAAGDVQGVDPLLGPLADNGGPTFTHLPLVGSPLLDALAVGTADLCDGTIDADQRGVARPQGSGCDVGAVERSPDD